MTMKYKCYSREMVEGKTREVIHLFSKRRFEDFMALLDPDFVWIGDYGQLYMKGIDAFTGSIESEQQQAAVRIVKEEYSVLAHERHLWVSYGRFTAVSDSQTAVMLESTVHFTFVWRQIGDALKLLHANASHVSNSDSPDAAHLFTPENPAPQSRLFIPPAGQTLSNSCSKIKIRDLSGRIHYLYPDSVLYIRSDNKISTLYTLAGILTSRIALNSLENEPFIRIHRTYLVNIDNILSICRYEATLTDGTKLPIGKQRYMDLKERLGHFK